MKTARCRRLFAIGLILAGVASPFPADAGDDKEKPDKLPAELRASQVSLVRDRKGKRSLFRASVIGKSGETVTFLTAAHCISAADEGGKIVLRNGEEAAVATIESVTSNPYYRPAPSGDIPGADNAVFRVKLDPNSLLAKQLTPVQVTATPVFHPEGSMLAVGMVDQFGKSHVVRAGNYSNPRWLEWGPNYSPVPGDSGSGVFVLRAGVDEKPVPVLVGVVVDRSERGGGASLTSLKDKWISIAPPTDPK